MGINSRMKTCTALDYLANMSMTSYTKSNPICLPDCDLLDFSMNIKENKFDFKLVDQQTINAYKDAAILIVYFETFYYDKITEYHESLTDFLCKYNSHCLYQIKCIHHTY